MRIFAAAFLSVSLFAAAAPGAELTLGQAAERMMRNNPALAQKAIQTEIARRQSEAARASYLPQLDFVQGWTRSNNPVFSFGSLLNQQNFSEANFAIDSLNHPSPLTDVSSKLQLGWLLFDFGKRESRTQSASSLYRVSQLNQESSRTALLQELVKRYYAVSLAQQQLRNGKDQLESAQSALKRATDRVEQGLAVSTNRFRPKSFSRAPRQQTIDAENQTQIAPAALKELLGTPDAEIR